MKSIAQLEDDYFRACNELTIFRHISGFEPGIKVIEKYKEGKEQFGIIAQYGEGWNTCRRNEVPVILENGIRQPWSMSNLTIAPK